MAFVETNAHAPTRHNPYLHAILLRELKQLPPGRVLDLPSGPGYLLRDLQKEGFSGIAGEIDPKLHCFADVQYERVDMTQPFPFADASFDYIVSVEGIEHITNHFSFLKECRRVLKPGGKLFLTTPNIQSLASRFYFFLSGFHSMAPKPIPLNTENIFFEHINPISFSQLYFYSHRVGLEVEQLLTHRFKRGSRLLYYLSYPFLRWANRFACFISERDPLRREMNHRLSKFLFSKENLLGTHTITVSRAC